MRVEQERWLWGDDWAGRRVQWDSEDITGIWAYGLNYKVARPYPFGVTAYRRDHPDSPTGGSAFLVNGEWQVGTLGPPRMLSVPHLTLAGAAMLWPALWVFTWRRGRSRRRGGGRP